MTTIVNRATVRALLDEDKNAWLTAQEVAIRLGYEGPMKNVSNALSGLFTSDYVIKQKKMEGRGVEYRVKGRGSYKPRATKQEDLPLHDSGTITRDTTPTTPNLMSPEFEILSVSLGKLVADNTNMRAALIKCRDAINHALQG